VTLSRRSFLVTGAAAIAAAPKIVRASSIMTIKAVPNARRYWAINLEGESNVEDFDAFHRRQLLEISNALGIPFAAITAKYAEMEFHASCVRAALRGFITASDVTLARWIDPLRGTAEVLP
jgi:hypothetical protein